MSQKVVCEWKEWPRLLCSVEKTSGLATEGISE